MKANVLTVKEKKAAKYAAEKIIGLEFAQRIATGVGIG